MSVFNEDILAKLIKHKLISPRLQAALFPAVRSALWGKTLVGWVTDEEAINDDLWLTWTPVPPGAVRDYFEGQSGYVYIVHGQVIPFSALIQTASVIDSILVNKTKIKEDAYQERVTPNNLDNLISKYNQILEDYAE